MPRTLLIRRTERDGAHPVIFVKLSGSNSGRIFVVVCFEYVFYVTIPYELPVAVIYYGPS